MISHHNKPPISQDDQKNPQSRMRWLFLFVLFLNHISAQWMTYSLEYLV
jgi:hypothetical protein